jgi:hypothetical protein
VRGKKRPIHRAACVHARPQGGGIA